MSTGKKSTDSDSKKPQKLEIEVKRFIVQQLACFDKPHAVVKSVKEEYGIDVSAQAVEAYDPNKKAGAALGSDLRKLFDETRKTFLEDTSKIGVSHRAVRLRALERMIEKAEKGGNMVLAAQLLEQVAKECGDAYTNTRKVDNTLKVKEAPTLVVELST